MHQRRGGGLLQGVLGALEIAGARDEGGKTPPPISLHHLRQPVLDLSLIHI